MEDKQTEEDLIEPIYINQLITIDNVIKLWRDEARVHVDVLVRLNDKIKELEAEIGRLKS